MRTPVYLIAIGSCLVLSWLFASRENWLGFALVLVAAVAYAARLVITTRADRRASAEAARGPRAETSAEQAQLKAELSEMREAYERSRRVMLLLTVIIAGLAAVAWPWNPALALALLIFSVPTLVLAWRSTRAIRKIDGGLASAR
ncbi:hypothetical protein [Brachybacterium sacelli]|uniref:Flp pilus assembly protein TadB n=1 Tax=Brachybacterium sacelli TaxID=173364 RepID=A0ABS4WXT7_9MICO|nr:hypothetical protein [Brachybacterium sacelli]MBP2380906.1 Flp pilus assembly protein TadB [Brachybacterium sacelli]